MLGSTFRVVLFCLIKLLHGSIQISSVEIHVGRVRTKFNGCLEVSKCTLGISQHYLKRESFSIEICVN